MKAKYLILGGLVSAMTFFSSCIDDELNHNPNSMSKDKLKAEWSLNAAISNAQLDPHLGERIFVLGWKQVAHFDRNTGAATRGNEDPTFTRDYLKNDYAVGWLRDANTAVEVAQIRIDRGEAVPAGSPYIKTVLQMARIWRAYLTSEMVDVHGPLPIVTDAFQGKNPTFDSEEVIYSYLLDELRIAADSLQVEVTAGLGMANFDDKLDLFYGGDAQQWMQYANSLRMRLAMRVSGMPSLAAKAKTEFEAAAAKPYINSLADIAKVEEFDVWGPAAGVMSRTWNAQPMSQTYFNLVVGLGNEPFPVPAALAGYVKDARTNMGLQVLKHFPQTTNDPSAGYYFNGIPQEVDPRAPVLYHIPGYKDPAGVFPDIFSSNGNAATKPENFQIPFLNPANPTNTLVTIDMKYNWSTAVGGRWDLKSSLAPLYLDGTRPYLYPSIANKYRKSNNSRVFFAHWESSFLLAEAKLKGWNVPGTVQSNYEDGIKASFEYHGVSASHASYITSTDYNRSGTSVAFAHTAEATDVVMNYVDGYTNAPGTMTYKYPKNTVYKNGTVNNDQLAKIITQKYLAQVPWLPTEAWADHRRLGLPFFENQAVEVAYDANSEIPLTPATAKDCDWKYYPQRFKYSQTWPTIYKKGYDEAIVLLGGEDKSTTPLAWSAAK